MRKSRTATWRRHRTGAVDDHDECQYHQYGAGQFAGTVAWLATLGLSLQFVASMLTTLPASLLMVRFGRRPFLWWVLIAAVAAALQTCIVIDHLFYFVPRQWRLASHMDAPASSLCGSDCAARKTGQKRYHMFWQAG